MIDDEVKITFIVLLVVVGGLVLLPVLQKRFFVNPYSELGLISSDGNGVFPGSVIVGESYPVILFIGNHEGKAQYYRVVAKLGDKSLGVNDVSPYGGVIMSTWDVFVSHESNVTLPVNLTLYDVGLDKRLVFELFRFDSSFDSFVYHRRWNQLWVNVIIP